MGGLRKEIPFTFWMMVIGTLALTGVGIPVHLDRLRRLLLQGRDHRGGLRLASGSARPTPSSASSLAACLTAFYSWRLIFMTFFGKRGDWAASLAGGDGARP